MLLIRCPWCGARDETEFRYGGQAHLAYPADPEALTDAEWADFLFMRDNPKGPVGRAVGARGGLPPVVQRGPRHGDAPGDRDLPAGRGAAGMTGTAPATGGTWIDRSRPMPLHVRRPRRSRRSPATRSRARCSPRASAPGSSRRSQGRPRGVFTAGVEEPNAFVEISAPWFEPIRPATMVNIVDGLVVAASRGRRRAARRRPWTPRPARHAHRHVDIAGDRGRERRARGGAGCRRAWRTRAAGRRAPRRARPAGRRHHCSRTPPRPASTTTATSLLPAGRRRST